MELMYTWMLKGKISLNNTNPIIWIYLGNFKCDFSYLFAHLSGNEVQFGKYGRQLYHNVRH